MSKARINLIIDALLLLSIAPIVGIGLLINYVLVPGVQRWEIYGRNVELLFWGLDRHDWGAIHYFVGLIFLALLVLHVALHWGAIVGISRKLIPRRFTRRLVAAILVALVILMTAFSAFIKPELREGGAGMGHGRGHSRPMRPGGMH